MTYPSITLKDWRKTYISKLKLWGRLMIWLRIYKVWYEWKTDLHNHPIYRSNPIRYEKANIFNPLLWVIVLLGWVGYILYSVVEYWTKEEIRNLNKKQKNGL